MHDTEVCQRILPAWFRQDLPDIQKMREMQRALRCRGLATVCQSARCPNIGQCWARGVATFMILGDICTRSCRFCAVKAGIPAPVITNEPERVAEMALRLGLEYVVVTSVTRDDLPDQGAGQFARTVAALKKSRAGIKIELLIPDFSGRLDLIRQVAASGPDVVGHNIETVKRIFSAVRPQADYQRSLNVLRSIRQEGFSNIIVKSGFMVGLGETDQDIKELMQDLRDAGCDLLTIGQYLAPSGGQRHVPVQRFVEPVQFERYRRQGMEMGFRHVFSAPLVRSSYLAHEAYQACWNPAVEGEA